MKWRHGRSLAWALACTVVLVACEREAPGPLVAEMVPGVAPFSELRGVRFGMRGRELLALRPGAVHAPYLGRQEPIGGSDTVFYHVDRPSLSEGRLPQPSVRLVEVSAARSFVKDSAALAAWHSRIGEIWTDEERAAACYGYGYPAGYTTTGPVRGGEVTVRYSPMEPGPGVNAPRARVRVEVVPRPDSGAGANGWRVPGPCPAR